MTSPSANDAAPAAPQLARRAATLTLIVVSPFALLGTVLTLALLPIFVGAPILLVSSPVVLRAWRARRSPRDRLALRRLRTAAVAQAVVLTAVLLATLAVGAGDMDAAVDLLAALVAVAWVAFAWFAAYQARSADRLWRA